MRLLDEQYLKRPYYGVARMHAFLQNLGHRVNIKRVRRLLRTMGLEAVYSKPKLSKANPEYKKYPYLLKGLTINKPNMVWSTDITYIPMKHGFLYLTAIIDWYSRYIIAWEISNSLDISFCTETLQKALEKDKPEIFNTDQGSQYTSNTFTGILKSNNIEISMDSKGRALDNIMIERFWKSVKYEYVYLNEITTGAELWRGLNEYFNFYNNERLHQALKYKTPYDLYFES
jgi:putative transposase